MENEKLSGAFTQKYDPMSDSFVVVENKDTNDNKERRFEPFSFFKRKNKIMESEPVPQPPIQPSQPPQQPIQPVQQPSNTITPPNRPAQRPQHMPAPNSSVTLARNAYNRLATLDSLYQTMAEKYPDNTELFNDLANETAILQATMLTIYQTLSGNNFLPAQDHNKPNISGNKCADLITIQNYLQNTIDTVIALQRSVNVQNIDRQLAIITATLFSQKSRLSSLQTSC